MMQPPLHTVVRGEIEPAGWDWATLQIWTVLPGISFNNDDIKIIQKTQYIVYCFVNKKKGRKTIFIIKKGLNNQN